MGSVWKAWDDLLERTVALKEVYGHPGLSDAQMTMSRQRVIREARMTARLHHPNAVTLFDVVEYDGRPCLIMQYVPSRSLSAVLKEQGSLEPAVVAQIGAEIAAGLADAHQVGVVHRDVKPGNVLITDDGSAKLTDFGISYAIGDVTLTPTGILAGTPAFLAPEVARGERSNFPADVFSLGATLYAALEGSPPFGTDENPIVTLHRAASGQITPPHNSGPLTPLLVRMLATAPADRPPMTEVSRGMAAIAAAMASADTRELASAGPAHAGPNRESASTPTVAAPTDRLQPTRTAAEPKPTTPVAAATPWLADATARESAPAPTLREPAPRTERAGTAAMEHGSVDQGEPTDLLTLLEATPGEASDPGVARIPRRVVRALLTLSVLLLLTGAIWAGSVVWWRGNAGAPEVPAASEAPILTEETPSGTSVATNSSIAEVPVAPTTAPGSATPAASSQPEATPAAEPQDPGISAPSADLAVPSGTTTGEQPPSAPTSTPAPTSEELAAFLSGYYALLPSDTDAGWQRLTERFQTGIARNRDYYESFWGDVQTVTATDVTGAAPEGVQATITYTFGDGRIVVERTAYRIVRDGTDLKIDDSTVLTSDTE